MFLLSLKAGGTGLNLTRADHVIHFDRWWNPAVEDQATDRAHRIGQTRPVQVHRLVTEGTIEQRSASCWCASAAWPSPCSAGARSALTELSNDELRDLVTLRLPRRRRMPDPMVLARAAPRRGLEPRSTTWWGRALRPLLRGADPARPTTSSPRVRWPARGASVPSWCSRRWPRPSSTPAATAP